PVVDVASPEGVVLQNVARLQWPRVLAIVLSSDLTSAAANLCAATLGRLTEATRDSTGPIALVMLLPSGAAWPTVEVTVWPPLAATVDLLPLWDDGRSLLRAGFGVYLGLRTYWEAAGQPEALERLAAVLDREGELYSLQDADASIDRILDQIAAESTGPT